MAYQLVTAVTHTWHLFSYQGPGSLHLLGCCNIHMTECCNLLLGASY